MSIYILVHGAFHGGWCWNKVVPYLEEQGHQVETPDLPGDAPNAEISLQAYVDHICGVIDKYSDPVILVGHSMGGIVISQVGECRAEKIQTLVYLSACLIRRGETVIEHAEQDSEALFLQGVDFAQDQTSVTLKEDRLEEVLYADCAEEDISYARSRLRAQAAAPLATPVNITEESFGRIPRIYISCLQDKAISPMAQKKMYQALPCKKIVFMDTSHSPFFSAPQALADHLLRL